LLRTDHIKTHADATNTPNVGKDGENGESSVPTSQKSTRSRYMSPTVSAKAKVRTSPKTRVEGEESPAKLQKRLSLGSPLVGRPKSPNINGAARSKSISQVSHCFDLVKLISLYHCLNVTYDKWTYKLETATLYESLITSVCLEKFKFNFVDVHFCGMLKVLMLQSSRWNVGQVLSFASGPLIG